MNFASKEVAKSFPSDHKHVVENLFCFSATLVNIIFLVKILFLVNILFVFDLTLVRHLAAPFQIYLVADQDPSPSRSAALPKTST